MRADDILQFVEGPNVLDVGCAGHVVQPESQEWLHGRLRNKFNVTGIDLSAENISKMQDLGFTDIHVQNADTFKLDRKFNTVVAGELIEHVSNPGSFLARVREHLCPGGKVVLSTPYVFSLMYAFYAAHHFPRTCQNGEHTFWFCPSTIGELAQRESFEVEQWHLVDDYSPSVTSLKYRAYWLMIHTLGLFLPDRFTKTNMIVVLRLNGTHRP
jgi:2-polyprenyl-3-methyl-5-hydroxy-6-metoxy-1,4-benzoquinol methylase